MTLEHFLDAAFGNILRFLKEASFRKEERGPISWNFVLTLLVVLVYGLVMLFSASYSTGYYRWDGDIYHFIRPQTVYAIVGFVAMLLISNINYRALRHAYWYLYVLTLLLLVWALFSEPQNGCHRWVYLFGNSGSLQPSELSKFCIILGFACAADDHYDQRKTLLDGVIRPLLPLAPVLFLLRLEPHNSAIILLCLIVGTMMVAGGCGLRWLPLVGAAGVGGILFMLLSQDDSYVAQRLGAWSVTSDGTSDDILYQTQQSLYSIASGGLTGLGIGNSRQKHLWLPEATNDFIFSVLCEELGFIGAVICLLLYAALIIQGILIALRAPDYFGTMMGIGIMAQIAWQVFCHVGVVTATLPNTGISLPFFSSGGTSLLMLMGEMGIMLSISRAGNARLAAQQRRQRAELARRMNAGQTVYRRRHSTI